MSIFWNIKDNGNDNDNKSRAVESGDESSDKKPKSKEYKKSDSFLSLI